MKILAIALVCAATLSGPATADRSRDLSGTAQALFARQQVKGALFAEHVESGRAVADFDSGGGALELPLSPVKLLLITSFFEHRHQLPPNVRPDIRLIIARGSDDAGRKLALDLRAALGSKAVLRDLARFGFPACSRARVTNCTTLSASTKDTEWADALSLGEAGFRTTTSGISHFLRLAGRAMQSPRGFVIRPDSALQLKRAMLETVEFGTAKGSGDVLAGVGAMGGKTGSTSIKGANPFDGMFAGLVFDASGAPRYTIVTFARRQGVGGGVAAHLSAEFAVAALKNS